MQFSVLHLFKCNHVVVIALPSHTSHVLQPLDVSFFKSALQREMHKIARPKKVLNAFDISEILTISYSKALTASNIISGFERTGIWVRAVGGASIEPLARLRLICAADHERVTLDALFRVLLLTGEACCETLMCKRAALSESALRQVLI